MPCPPWDLSWSTWNPHACHKALSAVGKLPRGITFTAEDLGSWWIIDCGWSLCSFFFSSDQFMFYGYVSVIIEFVLNECSHIFQCLKGSKGPSTCWGEWPQGGFGRWSHSVHRLRAGTSTSAGLFACSFARTIACGNSWPNRSQEIGKFN